MPGKLTPPDRLRRVLGLPSSPRTALLFFAIWVIAVLVFLWWVGHHMNGWGPKWALAHERDGHRLGAHTVARDAEGGVGGAEESESGGL